jgi:hypothetical protein
LLFYSTAAFDRQIGVKLCSLFAFAKLLNRESLAYKAYSSFNCVTIFYRFCLPLGRSLERGWLELRLLSLVEAES